MGAGVFVYVFLGGVGVLVFLGGVGVFVFLGGTGVSGASGGGDHDLTCSSPDSSSNSFSADSA